MVHGKAAKPTCLAGVHSSRCSHLPGRAKRQGTIGPLTLPRNPLPQADMGGGGPAQQRRLGLGQEQGGGFGEFLQGDLPKKLAILLVSGKGWSVKRSAKDGKFGTLGSEL